MTYEQTILVLTNDAKRIQNDLQETENIQRIYDRYQPYETDCYNVSFPDGIEMDIKICCSNYDENETGNPLWTEAVLFQNGCEIGLTEPDDEFFTDWTLEHNDNTYIVHVIAVPPITEHPDFDIHDIHAIKEQLASMGWDIEEKISAEGWRKHIGYSIWAKRCEWHEKFTYEITGHTVCFHQHTSNIHDKTAILETIQNLYQMATMAWTHFTNTVPCQTAHNTIQEDTLCIPFDQARNVNQVPVQNKER